jgi:hypothetical protein
MTDPLEPAAQECLQRTRSAVLNVLVAVGIGIAASGFFLAGRERGALDPTSDLARLLVRADRLDLLALIVVGYVARRIGTRRSALSDPAQRASRFSRAHVVAAMLGALAVPLGLLHGWAIRPQLEAVAPYWVAALALGSLSLPRAAELEGFDDPMPMSTPHPSEPRA